MKRALALLCCLGLLACAPLPKDEAAKPNGSEGTSYHLAGGGGAAVLKCNTWGFDTVCRSSGR
jgi:hypothetical protein